ncbi:MAG: ATP-dependent DNA helicase [Vulcanimicrobiaceae bacterium]
MIVTSTLSREQQAVVDADLHGPRLVDAGAGTGKTHTLVERARALVARGDLTPDQLLVVTFTKAAANDIAARLETSFGAHELCRPTCGTFHGIASDLMREFAYEAGVSPDIRVVDDGRARGIFARAFADLKAGRLDVDLSAFPLLDRTATLERSLATLALSLKQQGRLYADVFARAAACADELGAHRFGAVKAVYKNDRMRPKADWPRPNPERTPDERRDEALRERRNVVVVAALVARFQDALDREGLLTFGDVIVRATGMLHAHPDIAATLRGRWRHAIVDEFQDTNATQIALLEALFGPELRPVLVVGDVRQAIYEFNGADPRGIIAFRERAVETLPLTVNRRSFQPILDVAHHALRRLKGVAPELNAPLGAHRGEAEPACVRVHCFDGDRALDDEAEAIAFEIERLVARGASPRSCAVLLRTRGKAHAYAAALRARGLAVQLYGGVGFFEAPEIREVAAWLRIAVDVTEAEAIVGALQSAAIGLGDGAVAALARTDALARAALIDDVPVTFDPIERARLLRFREIARTVVALADTRLVDAVRDIVTASGAEIARGDDESLPQVRANLDKLVRFAADFAADRPLARVADLVAELRERDELELDLPLAELDGDRVSILTIHGAKGLEWDHVFVANVSASTFPLQNNDGRENVAQLDERTGALALKAGVDGRPTLRWYLARHTHGADGIVVEADGVPPHEEHRLLYVALTRARDALYVTGRITSKTRRSPCYDAVVDWATEVSGSCEPHRFVHERPPETTTSTFARRIDTAVGDAVARRIDRLASPVFETPRRHGVLSYTAMDLYERCPRRARYKYVLRVPDFSDESPASESDADGEPTEPRDPARYGRVVHRALELVTRARIAGVAPDLDDAVRTAAEEEAWLASPERRATARVAVASAVDAIATLTPLEAEYPFALTIAGVPMGGVIDLIARDLSGPIIVDYKTGRTPAQQYALQFALYARAVASNYPNAATRVLRVGAADVAFESVVPAEQDELESAILSASAMTSDEPRPGPQCAYCPYAHDACDAAP